MDSQRNLLVIALLFVSFMIWQAREQDKNPQPQTQQTMQTTTTAAGSAADRAYQPVAGKMITVKTDVLDLTINTRGGDVEQALLPAYPKELGSNEPFQLLETTPQFIYQAQSGLTGRDGPDNPANGPRPLYNVEKDAFVLADGQNELQVPMTYTDAAGNTFTKTFVFKRGDYAVNVNYSVQNTGEKPLEVSTFGQLKQSVNLPPHRDTGSSNFALHTFRGAAYSTPDEKYEKYKFDTIADNENLNVSSKGGWVAMLQQYFATAWIPRNDGTNNFYTANLGNGIVAIGYKAQPVLVQPARLAR